MTPAANFTAILHDYVGTIVARCVVNGATTASGIDPNTMTPAQVPAFLTALESGVQAFVPEPDAKRECIARLRELMGPGHAEEASPVTASAPTCLTVEITEEYDIVTARTHSRTLCEGLGLGLSEQVKITTVVSELARNIVHYVGTGRIELEVIETPRRGVEIRAIDQGVGIPNIGQVLSGHYKSATGMGVGLLGTQRLMDEFTIDTGPGRGTKVVTRKYV